MFLVKYNKIFAGVSLGLMALCLAGLFTLGLNLGVDFNGGTVIEISYKGERTSIEGLRTDIGKIVKGNFSLRPSGDKSYILSTKELTQEKSIEVVNVMLRDNEGVVTRLNTVGPVIGNELKTKSIIAIIVVIMAIVIFVTFAFRKVSKPVSSWKYGLATIIALVHDVIIPTGVFVLLGYFWGTEIDILFVTAMLAIVGYSISDTIVVFDRIRDNLRQHNEKHDKSTFEEIVGRSIYETLGRSLNTSLSLILVLLVLYFLGSPSTHNFVLALLIGVVAGTYSSICLASPLLLVFQNKKTERN